MKEYSYQGFTLIELVIVIVLIGILGATALPKFLDLTADARKASNLGVSSSLAGGVNLAHAKWLIQGSQNHVAYDASTNFVMSSQGWPVTTGTSDTSDNTPTQAKCQSVWNNIMQSPPNAGIGTCTGTFCYLVTAAGNVCTFTVSGTSGGTLVKIDYDITTGAVTPTAP